jgi:ABC-2 type transport system ATP-binding protein
MERVWQMDTLCAMAVQPPILKKINVQKPANDITAGKPGLAGKPVIHAENLTKQFGDEVAVNGATFDVQPGTIMGFIGPSGSGKTTLVRLLTGVLTPSAGKAIVLGRQPIHFNQATREKIGYMPQLFVLYPQLTVWENLNFAASIYGMGLRRGNRLKNVLDFVELYEHRGKRTRDTSGGMQRRLSLAATLVHEPSLIFLDEPTAGIDPVLRRKFWDHFRALRDEGRTLFVTTQYVGEAAFCDYVGVMANGRVLMVEPPEELRRRAYGGDMIDVTTSMPFNRSLLTAMRQLPFVVGSVDAVSSTHIRLTVDDDSTALPALVDWCRDQDLEVQSIEPYVPPYDDVFVELVKDQSNEEGA